MKSSLFPISINNLHWLPYSVYSYKYEQINGLSELDMFTEKEGITEGLNNWMVLDAVIDIQNQDDLFIQAMLRRVKHATGYFEVEKLLEQEGFNSDLNVDQLKSTILSNITPELSTNPNFPKHLEVRRNEFGELMAQEVLEQNTDIKFNLSTHSLIENPNTTKKGLDGFGLIDLDGDKRLVIMEVKTSEDKNSPPSVAKELMGDCRDVMTTNGSRKLIRTLTSLSLQYKNEPKVFNMLLKWIELIGVDPADAIHHICPVIIRGCITSKISDLEGFMGENQNYSPHGSTGVSCSTAGINVIELCNLVYDNVKLGDE